MQDPGAGSDVLNEFDFDSILNDPHSTFDLKFGSTD